MKNEQIFISALTRSQIPINVKLLITKYVRVLNKSNFKYKSVLHFTGLTCSV